MKSAFVLIPFLILVISCGNNDLIIQKAKKNCSCSNRIEEVYLEGVHNYVTSNRKQWNGPGSFECDPPFYSDEINGKLFDQTNTLELKNNSQTKVYQVTIQIDNNGNINYQEYKIEPTEIIELGCDRDFNVVFDYLGNESSMNAIKLSNLSKNEILYKIHKVVLISEY